MYTNNTNKYIYIYINNNNKHINTYTNNDNNGSGKDKGGASKGGFLNSISCIYTYN